SDAARPRRRGDRVADMDARLDLGRTACRPRRISPFASTSGTTLAEASSSPLTSIEGRDALLLDLLLIFATGAGDRARCRARRVVAVLMQEQGAKALFCDGHHIASATAEPVCRSSIGPAWAVRRLLTQPRLMRGFSLGLSSMAAVAVRLILDERARIERDQRR